MPGDSSDIDQALIAKLSADATLLSYMPNGVYWDEAPPHSPPANPMSQFVIVSLVDEHDERRFEGRSHEEALYLIKAVALSSAANASAHIKSAAARIDALLEDGSLTVTGYNPMALHRESRIRVTEVDEVDAAIRWYHRGGNYRVVMST